MPTRTILMSAAVGELARHEPSLKKEHFDDGAVEVAEDEIQFLVRRAVGRLPKGDGPLASREWIFGEAEADGGSIRQGCEA